MEASSCGKPVIGGRTGGAVEAVLDRVTGILVDPEDIHQVQQAIKQLLKDSAMRQQMGLAGRRRAVESFDWKILSRCFLKYIQS